MSVWIEYRGRFGNKMFLYACARLFATKHGLALETHWDDPILNANPCPAGNRFMEPEIRVTDQNVKDIFANPRLNAKYIFCDYFQIPELYCSNRDTIRSFFRLSPVETNSQDLLINVRLGDYKELGWVIHPEWYLKIIDQISYRKLYITTDEPDSIYFKAFKNVPHEFMNGTPKEQFDFIRSFNQIVMSNSTFCWWAAFLSDAAKIYVFKRWIGKGNFENVGHMSHAILIDGRLISET
jgi:hypothetical protein